MKINIEPTPELYNAPINGVSVPVRIWRGFTDNGIAIEAYVLSITPDDEGEHEKLKAALPFFMVPSRTLYRIGDSDAARQQAMDDLAAEPQKLGLYDLPPQDNETGNG